MVDEVGQLVFFIVQVCFDLNNVVVGIFELLINGIEYGNFGLSYVEKLWFKWEDGWWVEIDCWSWLLENVGKEVWFFFQCWSDCILLCVVDQGNGFDWQ